MRLLERSDSRVLLAAAMDGLRRGKGSVVLVQGEAGIGKTSLVGEFVGDVRLQARVLLGGCDDLAVPRPLGALREIAATAPALARGLSDDAASATLAELGR